MRPFGGKDSPFPPPGPRREPWRTISIPSLSGKPFRLIIAPVRLFPWIARGWVLVLFAVFLRPGAAGAYLSERLFFVGEEVEVLTLASRHPEPPLEAPAVSQVITAEEIRAGGFRTLAELLRTIPGLFVEEREGDARPFFRGVPEGFLLLYDGVPFTSDSTKALYHLREELSLASLERVEIVRGPGSVLWGPDAFAGLINLVPKRRGAPEAGVLAGTPRGDFSAHIFLPLAVEGFRGGFNLYYYGFDPAKDSFSFPGERGRVGRAEHYELSFGLTRRWLRLSGRLSHFRRPFVMKDIEGFSWPGEIRNPVSFLKFETTHRLGSLFLRGTFYYQYLRQREKELFLTRNQKNHLLYGELLFDRTFLQRNILATFGVSWRRNLVRDATVRVRGYLPDYLREVNRQFRPLVKTAEFETDLYSVFFQLRKKSRRFDFWLGARFNDHDHYRAETSYQAGVLLRLPRRIFLKLVYGTSYRTPYSAQFLGRKKLKEPEKMRSLGLELRYAPEKGISFFVSPFYNRISHHVAEDPYGGYSRPLTHYFLGFEAGFRLQRGPVHLAGALTSLNDWGDRETYRVLDYVVVLPGRAPIYHYSLYEKRFSRGPKYFGHLDLGFSPSGALSFRARLSFFGKRRFVHLKTGLEDSLGSETVLDLTTRLRFGDYELSLAVKNALDNAYRNAGRFSPVEGERFRVFLKLNRRW